MRIQSIKGYYNWKQAKLYQEKLEQQYKYVELITYPLWKNVKCIYEWRVK